MDFDGDRPPEGTKWGKGECQPIAMKLPAGSVYVIRGDCPHRGVNPPKDSDAERTIIYMAFGKGNTEAPMFAKDYNV